MIPRLDFEPDLQFSLDSVDCVYLFVFQEKVLFNFVSHFALPLGHSRGLYVEFLSSRYLFSVIAI